ncbi:MAG: FadR/GntR family transcriptional regulator [Deinococcota bacterium]
MSIISSTEERVLVTPVVSQSRAEEAASSLLNYLVNNELTVGQRLPAERVLAEQLGVSRGILREALTHLTTLGIVESRVGSGTFLCKRPSGNEQHVVMMLDAQRDTLLRYLELRRALETEVVALLAQRATAADIAHFEELVRAIETEHHTKGTAHESDKRFHLALYERVDNPLFLQILMPLWNVLESLWNSPLGNTEVGQGTLPLHRQLVECLRVGDVDGARASVTAMLDSVEQDLRTTDLTAQGHLKQAVPSTHVSDIFIQGGDSEAA